MTTTLLMRSKGSPRRKAAEEALREAGVGVVEVDDWSNAADTLGGCEAALLLGDEDLDNASRIANALKPATPSITHDAARALSHELRTPLSAMAGWVHLIETGKLDEAGIKRAASRLRGNIDDQVKAIEKFLGATRQEGRG